MLTSTSATNTRTATATGTINAGTCGTATITSFTLTPSSFTTVSYSGTDATLNLDTFVTSSNPALQNSASCTYRFYIVDDQGQLATDSYFYIDSTDTTAEVLHLRNAVAVKSSHTAKIKLVID